MREAMKTHVSIGLALFALSACVIDDSGTGVDSVITGPTDPAAQGDSIPAGAISYFKRLACPEGWEPYEDAAGRSIVPATEGLPRGATIGEPLAGGEERAHGHAIAASVDLPKVSYVGAAGGGNGGVGSAGMVTLSTTSAPASASIPYVQMLACKKTAEPGAGAAPMPSKMLMFFDADACPSGWTPAKTTAGRLLVGLPQYAPADRPFGAEPFTSAEPRTHTHTVTATLATSSHGIALASGCCADGYAQNGDYSIASDTDPTAVDVPVLALVQCQKE
jgi:hypothetical protein